MKIPYRVTNADLLRALSLGFNRMENTLMATSDSVTALLAIDTTVKAQVGELLADFANSQPGLSADDKTAILQVVADLQAESGNITAADPNAAPPAPVTPSS